MKKVINLCNEKLTNLTFTYILRQTSERTFTQTYYKYNSIRRPKYKFSNHGHRRVLRVVIYEGGLKVIFCCVTYNLFR